MTDTINAIKLTQIPRCFQCAGDDVKRELDGLQIYFSEGVTATPEYVVSRAQLAQFFDDQHCHNAATYTRMFLFGTVVYIESDSCEAMVL